MSIRALFGESAAQLMQDLAADDPAIYVNASGVEMPISAVLSESAEDVGEMSFTAANRPSIDVLKSEVPLPVQGEEIRFNDGSWTIDGIASSDGYITRLWVSEP